MWSFWASKGQTWGPRRIQRIIEADLTIDIQIYHDISYQVSFSDMKKFFSLDILFNDLGTHFWWEVWRLTLTLPGPKGITEAGPAILRFRYTLRLRSFPETTFQALALGKIPEWCLGREEGGSDTASGVSQKSRAPVHM